VTSTKEDESGNNNGMPFPCLNQLGRLVQKTLYDGCGLYHASCLLDLLHTFCATSNKAVVKAWEARLLCVCCVASLHFMIIAKATIPVAQVHPVVSW